MPATLHQAAKAGDAVEVERLLADGAELDERDGHGVTALGMAVGYNRLPVARILMAAGADVGMTDNRDNTALHYAAGSALCSASLLDSLSAFLVLKQQRY